MLRCLCLGLCFFAASCQPQNLNVSAEQQREIERSRKKREQMATNLDLDKFRDSKIERLDAFTVDADSHEPLKIELTLKPGAEYKLQLQSKVEDVVGPEGGSKPTERLSMTLEKDAFDTRNAKEDVQEEVFLNFDISEDPEVHNPTPFDLTFSLMIGDSLLKKRGVRMILREVP